MNLRRAMQTTLPLLISLIGPAFAENSKNTDGDLWLVRFEAPGVVARAAAQSVDVRALLRKSAVVGGLLRAVQADQAAAVATLEHRLQRPLQPRFRYHYGFNGVAIELDAGEAEQLRGTESILSVRRERNDRRQDAGARWTGAPAVWNGAATGMPNQGEGVVIGILDGGIEFRDAAFADMGGDGYNHSNPRGRVLGVCASAANGGNCNDKLIGIYDFVDAAGTGAETDGHGTAVASAAAGNVQTAGLFGSVNFQIQVSGVAPHANLISYKICTATTCPESAALAAMDQAVADGVDILNYSLSGYGSNIWAELESSSITTSALSLRSAGILFVNSPGNGGDSGTIGTPGNAPWVLAAGASTHDRLFRTELTELSGGTPPRASFQGQAIAPGMQATAPIVLGETRGNAACKRADNTSPFAPNALLGQIVICDDDTFAATSRSLFVAGAGGLGFVLANTEPQDELTAASNYRLPALHLGVGAANELKAWVRATPGARGRITATAIAADPALANHLASYSSRGPDVALVGALKPDLVAPGDAILTANHQNADLRFFNGTSASSPLAAGAAALVKAAHPGWGADRLASALALTADLPAMRLANGQRATAHDAGSGVVRVQQAVKASLTMPISEAEFRAANPMAGGRVADLNLPNLFEPRCVRSCVFKRRFIATAAGQWTVQAQLPHGVSLQATPPSFSLADGELASVELKLTVADDALLGSRIEGFVQLLPSQSGSPLLSLPVLLESSAGIGSAELVVQAPPHGVTSVSITSATALNGLHYGVLGPAVEQQGPSTLAAYAVEQIELDITAGSTLIADLESVNGEDVDLAVVRRSTTSVSGQESVCRRQSTNAAESCRLHDLVAGRYIVSVFNAVDRSIGIRFRYAVLAPGSSAASGPVRIAAGQSVSVRLGLELTGAAAGTRHLALLQPYAAFAASQPVDSQLLTIVQTVDAPTAPMALLPGKSVTVAVSGGTTVSTVFVDRGAAAEQLQVSATDAGVLAEVLAPDPLPQSPSGVLLAPATAQVLSTVQAGAQPAAISLALSPGQPQRFFIRLRNPGSTGASVTLTRSVVPGAASAISSILPGMYFNNARPGHGIFLSRARDDLQVAWYTYDNVGAPTFYLAFADNAFVGASLKPQLTLALNRYSWDGTRALGQEVGTASLTALGAQGLQWTWQLDQASGSEPMTRLAENACVETAGRSLDLSGLWFNPQQPGYGASVFTRPDLEIYAVYLYDGQGQPRWLWNDQNPFGTVQSPLYQYRGFCPGCTYAPVSRSEVGTLTRSYGPNLSAVSATVQPTGSWTIASGFNGGLPTTPWNSSGALEMLTAPGICR